MVENNNNNEYCLNFYSINKGNSYFEIRCIDLKSNLFDLYIYH